MFPADGITKADLAAYYALVAPVMLPHLRDRPVTMLLVLALITLIAKRIVEKRAGAALRGRAG